MGAKAQTNPIIADPASMRKAANTAMRIGQKLVAAIDAPRYVSVVRDVYDRPGSPRQIRTLRSFGPEGPEADALAEKFMGEVNGAIHMLASIHDREDLERHAEMFLVVFGAALGTDLARQLLQERRADFQLAATTSLDAF